MAFRVMVGSGCTLRETVKMASRVMVGSGCTFGRDKGYGI